MMTEPDPNPLDYYAQLRSHCEQIGVRLITPEALFNAQCVQPTKRTVTIRLSCFHQCVMFKQAWDVFLNMYHGECRMCRNSSLEELIALTDQDLAEKRVTQDQLTELDEDHYLLACLRCKAKKHDVPLGDMVDIWLSGEGQCYSCGVELFPTASTRSFYYVEREPGSDEDMETPPGSEPAVGVFVCGTCKD